MSAEGERQDGAMTATGYSTSDALRIAKVSESQLRSLVRAGVLSPRRDGRGWLFSMQDVVLLRTAGQLRDQLSAQRLHAALRKLRQQLPAGRALCSVQILADGGRVVVLDGEQAWEPGTGQGLLAFAVREIATEIAPLAADQIRRAARAPDALTAQQWYELGCDSEIDNRAEAGQAYRAAIQRDPSHADAHVNLGRMLHEDGDAQAGAAHYRAALAGHGSVDSLAVAAFNLGVACEDLSDWPAARAAYEQALHLDPAQADAHYNLARLLEQHGNKPGAVQHLREYHKLTREHGASG